MLTEKDGRGVETGAREAKAEEGWEAEQARGRQRQGGRGREGDESEAGGRGHDDDLFPHSPRPRNTLAKIHYAPQPTHRSGPLVGTDVAHAPADRNNGPTGVRFQHKEAGVKHFVYAGGPPRKTETYNPHCVADTWLAVLHDTGTYIRRVMYVTWESPMPRELKTLIDSHNGFPYP
ncbi:hypothetical protein DFH07DRAFT_782140 [Mycena maculata]|uniref:Uncharacterized protein n=1 Tax=Mycena maculata TaxID=230809 RepID=A0AAD7HUQ2_9AGAR|nr:hypothetical protein DFH07DRAFT_782140 [Mycena maculata]